MPRATAANTFDSQKHARWLAFVEALSPGSDPALVRMLGLMRFVAHAMVQTSEQSVGGDDGLTYAQYRLLLSLLFSEHEGHCTLNPSQISRLQGTSRNTVSALLRSLEVDGLVCRELDEHDRRKFNIALTEAGREQVRRHAAHHFRALNETFGVLDSAEIAQLNQLLDKLSAAAATVTYAD